MNGKNIDAAGQYRVELKERIELFGQVFYPGNQLTLRGDVLQTVITKVAGATLVAVDPKE